MSFLSLVPLSERCRIERGEGTKQGWLERAARGALASPARTGMGQRLGRRLSRGIHSRNASRQCAVIDRDLVPATFISPGAVNFSLLVFLDRGSPSRSTEVPPGPAEPWGCPDRPIGAAAASPGQAHRPPHLTQILIHAFVCQWGRRREKFIWLI